MAINTTIKQARKLFKQLITKLNMPHILVHALKNRRLALTIESTERITHTRG